MDSVLANMEADRSAYFTDVTEALADDPHIERNGNLIFLFLAASAPFLPTELPKRDLIGRLLTFVERNEHRIVKTVFHPAYITDKDLIKPVVGEFVMEMTAQVLKRLDDGVIDESGRERTTYHMSWPIDPSAFPYEDIDDEDDL